jgi:hypothetical protein
MRVRSAGGFAAVALCLLAAVGSIATGARANTTPTNFNVTLPVVITGSEGGTIPDIFVEGAAVVPHVGPATLTGILSSGCTPAFVGPGEPIPCRETVLIFVTPEHAGEPADGRTLVIVGSTEWIAQEGPPDTRSWTTVPHLGSDYTGSGTYTLSGITGAFGTVVTITLTGTLFRA